MKKIYESPMMFAETFVPNQYVAACGDTVTSVNRMIVHCQSAGHTNEAQDSIFIDNAACFGKYDSTLTNDNCHPFKYGPFQGLNSHGKTSSGTGFVKGTWNSEKTWFTESSTGKEIAYKGYFSQGGHYHLFYATTSQAEEFQGS